MITAFLATALAFAGDPIATVEGSVVRVSAHLDVPPARFLAQLDDPVWESRVSDTGATAEVKGRDGACVRVAYEFPNPFFDTTMELLRCPTADGWLSTLVTSDAFSSYTARWTVVPDGNGSRVTYEIDLDSTLWLPNSLVLGEAKRSVTRLMRSMMAWSAVQLASN